MHSSVEKRQAYSGAVGGSNRVQRRCWIPTGLSGGLHRAAGESRLKRGEMGERYCRDVPVYDRCCLNDTSNHNYP